MALAAAASVLGWRDNLLPSVVAAKPDLIIISAGFDAHEADPLGGLQMTSGDFGILTNDIIDAANQAAEHSGAVRVVSLLEGGYESQLRLGKACVSAYECAWEHLVQPSLRAVFQG